MRNDSKNAGGVGGGAKKLPRLCDGSAGSRDGDGDGDSVLENAVTMQGRSRRASVSSTDVEGGSDDDCDSPPKDQKIGWFSVNKKFRIGYGRTGVVFAGTLRGRGVAVKLAVNSTSSISLEREREFYRKLEHLQGECIPRIVSYDCGSDEGFNGFLMELLLPMPGSFDAWTPKDLASSKQSLATLQEKGNYIQNDLRPINFGKQEATGRVLVLDLEDLVPCYK